jgi:hypothetical protein
LARAVTWNYVFASDNTNNETIKGKKLKNMKRITVMLAMMLTLTTTWAFTGEKSVNQTALTAFKAEFAGATDASWYADNEYYRVTFTLNDQKLFAFYSTDGEFMAVTRYISSVQLPLFLQYRLRKFYRNAWVTDLFEVATKNGTSYYITLENADTKTVLKSINGSNWSVYQKDKKD